MWRSAAAAVLSIAVLLTDVRGASAASSVDWLVKKLTGTVTYTTLGAEGVPVEEGDYLSPGMSIETANNGRIRLERGIEWLVVLPTSKVTILATPDPGMDTTIKVEMGKIGVHVMKQSDKHFSVEAPQAVAAVKGTTFSVTAAESESEVAVIEGVVEVTARATREKRDVRSGEIASVAGNAGSIDIGGRQGDSKRGDASSSAPSGIAIFKVIQTDQLLEDLDATPPKAKGKSKKGKGKPKGKGKKGSSSGWGGWGGWGSWGRTTPTDDHHNDDRRGSNSGPD